jgi:hypothetical protein
MFWTYEGKREQARAGRGIAAFVSWLHLGLDWLRSRAWKASRCQCKQRKQVLVLVRCCVAQLTQGEAAEAVARLGPLICGAGFAVLSDKALIARSLLALARQLQTTTTFLLGGGERQEVKI